MGDPKKRKKKFETPRYAWRKDTLDAELKILGQYGLRNKHELWRTHAVLSKYRGLARSLLAKTGEEKSLVEEKVLSKLKGLGVIPGNGTLDDVLDLSVEDFLERRLQTVVQRLGLAKTPQQSRQLISHGHIQVDGRIVTSPSFILPKSLEDKVGYAADSPLSKIEHPIRRELSAVPTAVK